MPIIIIIIVIMFVLVFIRLLWWNRLCAVFGLLAFFLLLHSYNKVSECQRQHPVSHNVMKNIMEPISTFLPNEVGDPSIIKVDPSHMSGADISTVIDDEKIVEYTLSPLPFSFLNPEDVEILNRTLIEKSHYYQNTIIISIVDHSVFLDALNFHITVVKQFKLTNHLFLCMDKKVMVLFKEYDLACFEYRPQMGILKSSAYSDDTGDFGTQKYYDITNMKTRVLTEVLMLGFTTLICDVDIYWFQNPMSFLDSSCDGCHFQSQMDSFEHNTGFLYARPSVAMLSVLNAAYNIYVDFHNANDQVYFNRALDRYIKGKGANGREKLVIRELDRRRFATGKVYFEHHQHHISHSFPDVGDVMIVHNNYIGSIAAKRYRLRENLMWDVDIHQNGMNYLDGYYTNTKQLYISYDNPQYFAKKTLDLERYAFRNALILSEMLNRILILPEFHCCQCSHEHISCDSEKHKCSLLNIVKLKTFHKYFATKYREHSFLYNKRTIFKDSGLYDSAPIIFLNSTVDIIHGGVDRIIISPTEDIISDTMILTFFSKYDSFPLLKFNSLYADVFKFDNQSKQNEFDKKISEIFECMDYEQWEKKDVWV